MANLGRTYVFEVPMSTMPTSIASPPAGEALREASPTVTPFNVAPRSVRQRYVFILLAADAFLTIIALALEDLIDPRDECDVDKIFRTVARDNVTKHALPRESEGTHLARVGRLLRCGHKGLQSRHCNHRAQLRQDDPTADNVSAATLTDRYTNAPIEAYRTRIHHPTFPITPPDGDPIASHNARPLLERTQAWSTRSKDHAPHR